ncbi:YraN family protein [Desulfosediminicola ganghwensis]|uniref:YraN family protein n=1 Tax=Desulfosediminicola ganghwensis TaxID=2569540 RepID=UPI0010AB67A2|nr:YraN family protein [Desulfosediminicola ganghwensis]
MRQTGKLLSFFSGTSLGDEGEKIACQHLKKSGYSIILRNFRCRSGEVDIIARHKGVLVFIEVKTRRSESFGSPAAAVTPRKQRQIAKAALEYLARENLFDTEARFDVVSILVSATGEPQIEIITSAFELG